MQKRDPKSKKKPISSHKHPHSIAVKEDGNTITGSCISSSTGVEKSYKLEQKLSSILASITDCHYELDKDYRFISINDHALAYFGKKREKLLGKSYWDVFPNLRESIFKVQFEKATSDLTSIHFDVESILYPGKWVEFHGYPTEEGGILVFFRDITNRRQAESQIEVYLSALSRMHMISRKILGAEGIESLLQEIMDTAVSIVGAQRGTLQILENDSLHIVAHHGHKQPFLDFFTSAIRTSVCGEAERSGKRVVIQDVEASPIFAGTDSLTILREAGVRSVQSTPIMSRQGLMLGILTTHWDAPYQPIEKDFWWIDLLVRQAADLIESVKTNQALFGSNQRLQALMNSLPIGISFSEDPSCQAITGNPTLYQQFEITPGDNISASAPDPDAVGRRIRYFRDGHEVIEAELPLQRAVAENRQIPATELEIVLPSGRRWFAEASSAPIRDGQGRVIGGVAVTTDITYRKQAEETLRRSREDLDRAQEVGQIGWWRLDTRQNELTWSDENHRIFGIPKGTKLTYETFLNVVHPDDRRYVDEKWIMGVRGEPYDIEHRIVVDGHVRWVREKAYLEFDGAGGLLGGFGITQDITARKHVEESLEKTNKQLEFILSNSLDAAYLRNIQTDRYEYVSPVAERLTGFTSEEMMSLSTDEMLELVHHDDLSRVKRVKSKSSLGNDKKIGIVEYRFRTKSGKFRWLSDRFSLIYDSNSNLLYRVGIVRDISERKENERELRRSRDELELRVEERTSEVRKALELAAKERQRLYDVLEALPAMICLLTPDYHVVFANRSFREKFGESEGRHCYDFCFGNKQPCDFCQSYEVLKTGRPHHWEVTSPDGNTVMDAYDFPFSDVDGSPLILEMDIDITEQKKAQETLKRAAAYDRSLIEASVDLLVTINHQGMISDVNTAAERVTGYARDELIGTDFCDYFTDPSKAKAGYEHVFREGTVRDYELEILHKDGHMTPVLYNASVYRDESGKVVGVFAAARDISERRRMEQVLRESEERYRTAIESASDGVALMRGDEHIYVNRRFAEIFGYDDPSEITGKPHALTVHPDDLAMVSEINRMRQKGEPVPSRYEFRGIRKDGTQRNVEVSATMINYRGEPASLVYLRDITDYKNLEDQLRQSQKMEAIGTLAGGIAHDFNNILAAIIGFAEMVEEDLPQESPSIPRIGRVISAANRGKELVRQILTFSRKAEPTRKPQSLAPIIEEAVQFLRASLPSTIDINLSMKATKDTIVASPTEIQQILMNLATNAAFAMREKGGALGIRVTNIEFEPHSPVLDEDVDPGEYVQLTVTDTGIGMPTEVMKRAFDPFFTTKEVGKGTGMGLAVVYGIVKSLGGTIAIESEPGISSTFRIFLPVARIEKKSEEGREQVIPKGTERVLFVDDEELLMEWGQAALERLGYTVTAVTDSTQALNLFSSDPSAFDLVILDQTMPGLTGLNLSGKLLAIRANIPIILCTGHSDSVTSEKAREAGIKEFLLKPLRKQQLAEVVRRVLNTTEHKN